MVVIFKTGASNGLPPKTIKIKIPPNVQEVSFQNEQKEPWLSQTDERRNPPLVRPGILWAFLTVLILSIWGASFDALL